MKKILIICMLLLFPMSVYADEISIECNDLTLENNKETTCAIKVKDLSFNATNVTGTVTVSENLKITSSSYDNTLWKILDDKFNVASINLISENPNNGTNFTIATFKIKAINDKDSTGEISFTDIGIGDDSYNDHIFESKTKTLELTYDNKNADIKDNPNTSDIKVIIPLILIVTMLGITGYIYKKRKVNE